MSYEIRGEDGKVIATASEWGELMQKYRELRNGTKEPLFLEKVVEDDAHM